MLKKEIEEIINKYGLKCSIEEFPDKVDWTYISKYQNLCGRGSFNKAMFYEKGKYYRDWKCDLRPEVNDSFGLGIWPEGNTPVKVSVRDWGVALNTGDGKARVWGFTVL